MEPRPAATVILARPAEGGVEVLVLTRGPDNSFLPGFAVFPGGTIDPSDAELAARLFGDREEVARACALRELQEETGIRFEPQEAESLVEVARWVAPEFIEKRFDARFFAAPAPDGAEPVPDGKEASEARFVAPSEVLDEVDRGRVEVFWPTLVMLRALAECATVEDVLDLRVEQTPNPAVPR
ncbi:MAG: NUDIX hydrolase [Actinomycetota bacterium]